MTSEKLHGYEFWEKTLKKPYLAVAPMVDQSELAWRMLSRRYGAQLCYTPMLHAPVFTRSERYRKEGLASCPEDRPLIVQFCANDPDILLTAAKMAEDHCDGIDLNLGCPQGVAKRGHYGAFLQDEWDLIKKMITICAKNLKVPITAKIRVFDDIEKTVKYAKMLEEAGCQILTVHGRTREQKGQVTGLADWSYIKAVKDNLKIPVFANGNIQYLEDVHRCMKETGVDGVMSAEGNLCNPAIFKGIQPPTWQMAEEYMELAEKYPCPLSYVRGHIFKLFRPTLEVHDDMRDNIGNCKNMEDMMKCVAELKARCIKDEEEAKQNKDKEKDSKCPHWLCQPYVRPDPNAEKDNSWKKEKLLKRTIELSKDEENLSRNKVKKRIRNPEKSFTPKKSKYVMCVNCSNIRGDSCVNQMCKLCCKVKSKAEVLDCRTHKCAFKRGGYNKPKPKLAADDVVACDKVKPEDSNSTLSGHENGSKTCVQATSDMKIADT